MARIKNIDTSKARALPGVLAVLTAADLKPLNLHYMPTLAGDVQAVLADEKVLFQNQEIAFVVARDRYIAADAIELVEVEYEPLPVLVDPFKALEPDAPLLREDIKDKMTGRARDRASITTTSSSGISAIRMARMRPSPKPMSSPRTCSPITGCTRRRWRLVSASPRWTRSGAN